VTPERWARIREIFGAAMDIPDPEVNQFLDSACQGDMELRIEVERMLAGNREASWSGPTAKFAKMAAPEPAAGDTVSHYRVVERLGRGGMGTVYKGLDLKLGREVALKFLSGELMEYPMALKRFEREARAASALNHPNICTIHEFSEDRGRQFIVMEYVPGKALDQLIPLRTAETLNYALQIADALAKAHGAGIVHRDLKPANVMITSDGHVKVLDFGVAKVTAATKADDATLTYQDSTETGAIVGTTPYMSPEQAEGKPVDARSDIFSFGAVLYEMLTGQKAFQGDSQASTLAALLTRDPKPLSEAASDVPEDFEKLIARCLRKDRERRYQNAIDLKIALLDLKEESEAGKLRARRQKRRDNAPHWRVWALAATLAASLAVAGWFAISRNARDQTPFIVRPVTTYEGEVRSPTFSRDGTQIAFAWNGEKQDNNDIYVKVVDSGPPLRLTTNGADDDQPSWSPDGRYIAFLRDTGEIVQLLLISPLGGVERKLADLRRGPNAYWWSPPAWTPDSKFLAVRDDTAIVLISVESGEKRKVTSPPEGWAGDHWAAISPDGRTLAFGRMENGPFSDVYVTPLSDGRQARRITHNNSGLAGLTWTPDGRELIFSVGLLFRIPATGGTPAQLPNLGNASMPAVARQGRRAAFVTGNKRTSLWRQDLNQQGLARGTPVRLLASSASDEAPMISPDGRRIAFTSDRSGNAEIWVCDSSGGDAVQLTSLGFARDAYWSPDSKNVVFEGRPENRRLVFTVSADGGKPRQISSDEGYKPSWSRDGRWIYYLSRKAGSPQTWKIPAIGGTAIQLTKGKGGPGMESLDGKYFLYHTADEDGLWKIPVNGGDPTLVMKEKPNFMNYWAIAPQGLYFRELRGRESLLRLLRFETGRSSQIAALNLAHPAGDRLSLPANGSWVLYDQTDRSESDIMLIENFH